MICHFCGSDIGEEELICPSCGRLVCWETAAHTRAKTGSWPWENNGNDRGVAPVPRKKRFLDRIERFLALVFKKH